MAFSWVPLVRLLQSFVSMLGMITLCSIYRPVRIRGQPSPILETSYGVNVAVLLTCVSMIYSGVLFIILYRCDRLRTPANSAIETFVDVALALLLLLMALILADNDDLKYCHQSVNVLCDRFLGSIAILIMASLLYGASISFALISSEDDAKHSLEPETPASSPKTVQFATPLVAKAM